MNDKSKLDVFSVKPPGIAWTIEDALLLVKTLWEPLMQIGAHIGLTGSILYRGTSTKDLDLIIYPRKGPQKDFSAWTESVVVELAKHDLVFERTAACIDAGYDDKDVRVFSFRGRRVDVFFME